MKKIIRYSAISFLAIFVFVLGILSPVNNVKTSAKAPLDEILEYKIKVDPQADASLTIRYDIKWKVLDSDSYGPLDEVKVGIPNNHANSVTPLSSTIKRAVKEYSGGYVVKMDLDRKYYENEVVDLSFEINTGYMYQLSDDQSQATYTFSPGWFDEIDVDKLEISWNMDKVQSWSPDAKINNNYLVWTDSLNAGEKYTVKLVYNGDAFTFDMSTQSTSDDDEDMGFLAAIFTIIIGIIFIGIILVIPACIVILPIVLIASAYNKMRGFGNQTETKITRTKIEYYPSCPNCGGTKSEDSDVCSYCGTNMIKSEEVVKEEVANKDPEISKYKTDGVFHYGTSPHTYVRVHVVNVPKPRPKRVVTTTSSTGRTHSSCAHSSCACACACACAGGGRAGCTTKDFYKTNLKLKNLKPKNK